jgi:hypothetical protein
LARFLSPSPKGQRKISEKRFILGLKDFGASSTLSLSVNNNTLQKEKIMSHHIEDRDVQAGTQMAWQGLTKVVPVVQYEDAFPFEIERLPLLMANDTPLEGWSFFRCSDDGKPAGVPVSESYSALTNARFWEVVQNSVGGTNAIVESAGTIYDRCRRFVTVKLGTDVDDFTVGDRQFKNRFSILDSIDGSTNFYGVNSSTCVVCANTFAVVMGDTSGEFRFKIRHSKNILPKIENMEKAIDQFIGVTAQFKKALEIANEIPVTPADARSLFAGWTGADTNGMSSRTFNTVTRLAELFQRGAGNNGETLLDAFSAVTDFYSHESSGGADQPGFRVKQALSSEFGSASRKKQDFFSNLFTVDKSKTPVFQRASFDQMVNNGRTLITAAEAVLIAN